MPLHLVIRFGISFGIGKYTNVPVADFREKNLCSKLYSNLY